MIFAFFFKSLFLLTGTSIKLKTTFGHFFFLLCVATDRKDARTLD